MLRLLDARKRFGKLEALAGCWFSVERGRMPARNARARALAEFLGDRNLEQYGRLFAQLGESR